jgi:phosphopantothenoylcysteine decarboxylase/phosphopantothenate--cysteine ligase
VVSSGISPARIREYDFQFLTHGAIFGRATIVKVIVTCGPSYEPIDEVRRLTNFSTGELGVLLSNELAQSGFEVFCLKGSGATAPGPSQSCHVSRFNTNDDLLALLEKNAAEHEIEAVFQAAALCDYRVERVTDEQGRACDSPKIASRSGALTIHLEPATKVIAHLRRLFPKSWIVGWKYELAGTPGDALARAQRQLDEARVDACVVNGRAYGPGFGILEPPRPVTHCADKSDLVRALTARLREIAVTR